MTWDPLSFANEITRQTDELGGAVFASIGGGCAQSPALLLPQNGQSGDYSIRMSATAFSARPHIGAVVRVNGLLSGRLIQTTAEAGFLVLRVADFVDE